MQAGDSSLDQLKEQSKLEDYVGFFHLPSSQDEDNPTTVRDPQRVESTEAPPTTSGEVIDLTLSTDEEGDDDRSDDVIATTSSGPGGKCDVQQIVTSKTSVTGKLADHPSDGKWACPICTLYAPPSPPPLLFTIATPFPPASLHSNVPIFIPSISHRHGPTRSLTFFLRENQPSHLSCDACGSLRPEDL